MRIEADVAWYSESVVGPHQSWHFEGNGDETMETRGDLFYVWAIIIEVGPKGRRCKLQPTYGMQLKRDVGRKESRLFLEGSRS